MTDKPSTLKRPANDNLQNGDTKRIRSNNGSPAPQTNGTASNKVDISKNIADARARAAAVAARLRGTGAGTNGVASPAPTLSSAPTGLSRAEELKARVAAAMGNKAASSGQRTASPAQPFSPPPLDDGFSQARGGLGTALHPALMDSGGMSGGISKTKQPIQSKFATTLANQRPISPANVNAKGGKPKKQLDLSGPSAEETRNNPYFDASLGAQTATLKARNRRELAFNAKGKYIQQAALQRKQQKLEEMKLRIQASAKKAFDKGDPSEKNFMIEAPPELEWWDENLVKEKSYNDLSDAMDWDGPDSVITRYVQHPVLLEPPSNRLMPEPKAMYLTKTEQAKLRRQRRMENLKEQQAKVRLGLEPPEPPKVKLKNMMMVLGSDAVKDPTAVEARVRKEVAERAEKHEQMNEDRKLTKEEKHEKLEQKMAQDEGKGVYLAVFKIDSLANGRHRFKIGKNAEQMGCRGLCLMSRSQSLVMIETGAHSLKAYKKLMLNRIDWTENSVPNSKKEGNAKALAEFLENEQDGNLKDLSLNKCQLIFEGQQKEHQFRKWGTKVVESDKEAMDLLDRTKMGSFWTLAKSLP
ncbi:U4/U6 small nuclear ribonucleoprotein PRP3, partial [Lecanoromycetidae sp. Uapishka_2]